MNKVYKYRNQLDYEGYKPNRQYQFIDTDSENQWKKILKYNTDNHSVEYYIKNPIQYKLNNYGFRTPDDFNNYDEGNVFLGCSHTFGVGHHLENTWSYKLNQTIGGKFWNLGIGGSGVMTHFRLLLGFYKELKIKNIFHFAPKYPRYEFIENGVPQHYILNEFSKNWKDKFGNLVINSLLTNEQIEFNWLVYTNAIKSIANEVGCNYYLIEGDIGLFNTDESLLARDLVHHTTKEQDLIYKNFLKLYDENLYEKIKNVDNPIFDIKNYMKKTFEHKII
jgi:hypothetical protein